MPKFCCVSESCKEILRKLLETKETEEVDVNSLLSHEFFSGIERTKILSKKLTSPFIPMNKEIKRINNLGVITPKYSPETQKLKDLEEKYTLFNYEICDFCEDIEERMKRKNVGFKEEKEEAKEESEEKEDENDRN